MYLYNKHIKNVKISRKAEETNSFIFLIRNSSLYKARPSQKYYIYVM